MRHPRSARAPRIRWQRVSAVTLFMAALTLAILIGGSWALLHTHDTGDPGHVYPTTTTR